MNLLTVSFAAACLTLPVFAQAFADGFEGPTLDPWWTPTQVSGSIVFPSSRYVHSGTQSLEFASVVTSADKNVHVTHNFPQPVYGCFSVWMFDAGAGVSLSNSFWLYLEAGNQAIYTGVPDYDTPSYPWVMDSLVGQVGIRTQGWHFLEITRTATETSIRVDGTTAYSGAGGAAVDRVRLHLQAPRGRPAFSSCFDDFLYAPPLPSAYALFGNGCAGSNGTPTIGMPAAGPELGQPFSVTVSQLPAASAAFGILGVSDQMLGSVPLPLSLGTIGMPGCSLLVSNEIVVFLGLRPTPTTADWTIPIPPLRQLLGASFYQQAAVIQPGANPTGVIMSNGGHGTIGGC